MPKEWEKRLEQLSPSPGAGARRRAHGGGSLMVDRPPNGGPSGSDTGARSGARVEAGPALKPLVVLAAVQAVLLVVLAVVVARYAGVL
jgi:hypothetical protein